MKGSTGPQDRAVRSMKLWTKCRYPVISIHAFITKLAWNLKERKNERKKKRKKERQSFEVKKESRNTEYN